MYPLPRPSPREVLRRRFALRALVSPGHLWTWRNSEVPPSTKSGPLRCSRMRACLAETATPWLPQSLSCPPAWRSPRERVHSGKLHRKSCILRLRICDDYFCAFHKSCSQQYFVGPRNVTTRVNQPVSDRAGDAGRQLECRTNAHRDEVENGIRRQRLSRCPCRHSGQASCEGGARAHRQYAFA